MSSRVLLSIWAFLVGGLVVFGLISTGTLEPFSLGRASVFDQIVFVVLASVPLIAWCVVFFRTP